MMPSVQRCFLPALDSGPSTLNFFGSGWSGLGVYTHVGLHDQTAAIESLPAPPASVGSQNETAALHATGTDDVRAYPIEESQREVPTMVPLGAENGAVLPAPRTLRFAPDCTDDHAGRKENGDPRITATPGVSGRFRTQRDQSGSQCTESRRGEMKVSPAGFEPATSGFGGRRSIQLSYGDKNENWKPGRGSVSLPAPRLFAVRNSRGAFLQSEPVPEIAVSVLRRACRVE